MGIIDRINVGAQQDDDESRGSGQTCFGNQLPGNRTGLGSKAVRAATSLALGLAHPGNAIPSEVLEKPRQL